MLLDGLTVFENICVPKVIKDEPYKSMEKKARKLLSLFDIQDIANKFPAEISGGQKQRTAVARALMNNPLLILADEPTGNLDSRSSEAVIGSFLAAQQHLGSHHLHGDPRQLFRQLLQPGDRHEGWTDLSGAGSQGEQKSVSGGAAGRIESFEWW